MSAGEVDDLLATARTMSLATLGSGGWPHVVAMWFAVHDGSITFMAFRRSQKCRNLAHDDRVTCLVETGTHYDELRGVQIRGRAVEVVGDKRLPAACAVARRYSDGPVDPDEVARQIRARVVYAVTPIATVSWDHRKLAAADSGDLAG
ncbi:pyridoxamine 5'-phosphate oxidase family protein [Mycobacterium conspicuum]|jgi:nitroimidazol reductase NimA-like FMN-containing flavoprotein (pyridoxamine 5'-phosphate oxidase superfamily)|nr:pyridoxamine 5'-phosphate oxidase family protein [Mycobacterium conspicuum]